MASGKESCEIQSLPKKAKQHYVIATAIAVLLWAAFVVDILYLRPGPLLAAQKAFGILLALAIVYTQTSLREEHQYYVEMTRSGCEPLPLVPNDPLGIRFLLNSAQQIKSNTLLVGWTQLFGTLGHTYGHRMFPNPGIIIATDEPENVRTVLSVRFDDWGLPQMRIRAFLPILGQYSIFTTNGDAWRHARATLRPAFVRDQVADLRCLDRHIAKLIIHIPRDGRPFDLQAMFSMLTTDTISDFMFGNSTDLLGRAPEDGLRFGRCFDVSMQKIANRARLGWLMLLRSDRELDECTSFMNAYVENYIAEVRRERDEEKGMGEDRQGGKRYVFLNELLQTGESDEVIRDHLVSIFTAGRDTTTSVLSYLFFELSRRPDVVAIIRREVDDLHLSGMDQLPAWESLRNMKYLNWAVREALRLNPPVATNSREAVRDTIVPRGGGSDGKSPVFVKKGTIIRYFPWALHRRRDIYGDDADEFRPERWETLRTTYEYIPFNAGPRICVGQQFALTQVAFVTFRILQAFSAINRRDDRPPIQKFGINTSLLHGCWVSMTPA
ncbi:cytochrome P450 [Annulohypoxylon maeteangense]|uniref:cytochrome P450 n=1 Tax=Annulohypoxylon maeteangense TaxID=1927788 RepID=UPI002008E1B3|nr:cytochrome P450 [Annulohypoxylon maeteangense]KAI0880186.1 cytochrome P450 [Annulohypoxylon maeteangense]